ncbi:MAG: DUF11 domain-containing protein [Casimicrobiaceae bacterium]|nr:DUF11 domain-containing protein [Casimicrobiaceae bacterium]
MKIRREALRRALLIASAVLALGALTHAAPTAFPLRTTPVRLDGVPLGSAIHPVTARSAILNTILFHDGLYHLWVMQGGDTASVSDRQVEDITYATSTDGIHFTSIGKLSPPPNWWTNPGPGRNPATAEPRVSTMRAVRQDGQWLLLIWTGSTPGGTAGDFNYNTHIWSLGTGSMPSLSATLYGPIPSLGNTPPGPGGNHAGLWGLVNGQLYLGHDSPTGGMGRYGLTLSNPPATSPSGMSPIEAALYTGTGKCWFLAAGCTGPSPQPVSYAAVGRVIAEASTLGAYYGFVDNPVLTAAPFERQFWYVESSDNGLTWSAPQPVYPGTSAQSVTVDGLQAQGPAFSSVEVVARPAQAPRPYFATRDVCGNVVFVTEDTRPIAVGLQITKAFEETTLPVGGTTILGVTLIAPPAVCTPAPSSPVFTQLSFTDALPPGLVLASTGVVVSNSCGGTLVANPGAASLTLSGVNLAAGASCTLRVRVTATQPGRFLNQIVRSSSLDPNGLSNEQSVPALADAVAELSAVVPPIPINAAWMKLMLALLLGVVAWRRLAPRRFFGGT